MAWLRPWPHALTASLTSLPKTTEDDRCHIHQLSVSCRFTRKLLAAAADCVSRIHLCVAAGNCAGSFIITPPSYAACRRPSGWHGSGRAGRATSPFNIGTANFSRAWVKFKATAQSAGGSVRRQRPAPDTRGFTRARQRIDCHITTYRAPCS